MKPTTDKSMLEQRRQFFKLSWMGLSALASRTAQSRNLTSPAWTLPPPSNAAALQISVFPTVAVIEIGRSRDYIQRTSAHCWRDMELIRAPSAGPLLDRLGDPLLSNATQLKLLFLTGNFSDPKVLEIAIDVSTLSRARGILTVVLAPASSVSHQASSTHQVLGRLADLQSHVDSVVALPPLNPLVTTATLGSDVVTSFVIGLRQALEQQHVAIDLDDIQSILRNSRLGYLTSATANGEDGSTKAAQLALDDLKEHELGSNPEGAMLLISTAPGTLRLKELKAAVNVIRNQAPWGRNFIYAAAVDEALEDATRVSLLVAAKSMYS